jgi:hypothetical protein
MKDCIWISIGIMGSSIALISPVLALTQAEKNTSATYEDDRLKVTVKGCDRQQQELICQAILTSKNGERQISLTSDTIKLVDFEGNEFYPNNITIANRSHPKQLDAELVENATFRASISFINVPKNITKFALFQMPLGNNNAIAKFRNLALGRAIVQTKPSDNNNSPTTTAAKSPSPSTTNNLCPNNTKVVYRAATNQRLLYICGKNQPTHYVSTDKDGNEKLVLTLQSHGKNRFVAEKESTRYVINGNRFSIAQNERVVLQEKLEVLSTQPKPTVTNNQTPTKRKPVTAPAKTKKTNS